MRAISWNEMQLDPAVGPRKPFLHQLGVMIACIVHEDMDEQQHRIEGFDRFQQPYRRGGVDGFDLDHPSLPGLEVDGAMNVDALTPARLFDRELFVPRCPAAHGPRRMSWMHRVNEQHSFIVRQGIQEIIVALNERLLLHYVELARNDIRLVIFQSQTMQQRDQPRAAFINETEFRLDPGPDLAGRTRQSRSNPDLQFFLLLAVHLASTATGLKTSQPFKAILDKQAVPPADRVVIQQKRPRDLFAAPAGIQKHQRIGATRQSVGRRSIPRQRSQVGPVNRRQKTGANHTPRPVSYTHLRAHETDSYLVCRLLLEK